MSEFKISAPGRIVLSGEHAAMYGKPVVMTSLDRYTTVKFSELSDCPREIKIEFPDVALSLNVSLELVQNFFFGEDSFNMTLDHYRLLRLVKSFITLNGMWITQEQRFSLQTFFFLLLIIAHDEKFVIKSFHVHVSTQLPIGAGFGSSSSFAVCLAACFLHWTRLQHGAHPTFNEQELTIISNYAMYCERKLQDYMFGADNYVCSYGGIIKSRYAHDHYDNTIINMPSMRVLLFDSRIRKTKSARATEMAHFRHTFPWIFDLHQNIYQETSWDLCESIDALNNIHRQFVDIPLTRVKELIYLQLQILINVDQLMLQSLELSDPTIDSICSMARNLGYWGKPTGYGGFVYILEPTIPEEKIRNFEAELREKGFDLMLTSVNCSGVRIDN